MGISDLDLFSNLICWKLVKIDWFIYAGFGARSPDMGSCLQYLLLFYGVVVTTVQLFLTKYLITDHDTPTNIQLIKNIHYYLMQIGRSNTYYVVILNITFVTLYYICLVGPMTSVILIILVFTCKLLS